MNLTDYKSEIANIVDKLRKNQIAVFCGAGATYDFTGKSWKDLFESEFEINDKEEPNFYKFAQFYELHMSRSYLETNISNAFSKKVTTTNYSKHIKALLQLPITEFWTTNFDTVIESMIENETQLIPSIIYNSENLVKINENKKYKVFKMNGSLTDTKSMVITENDYNKYLVEQQVLFEQLKRELILNSFIFIGYSFSDNLVLNCLSEIKRSLPHLNNFHYRVAVKDTEHPEFDKIEKRYFENGYNIKTIYVDNFNEIDDFLNHLHQLYKEKNIFISGSFRNFSTEEENYANKLCKALVEKLLDNGYNIYSGDGKRLGSYIISNSARKLMGLSEQYIHNKLTIMPYIDHTFKHKSAKDEERVFLIEKMISNCSTSIFLYGQSEEGTHSEGVLTEFQVSQDNGLNVIPLVSTGFSAEKIFTTLKENNLPYYLERYESKLNSNDIEDITSTVIEILKEINRKP